MVVVVWSGVGNIDFSNKNKVITGQTSPNSKFKFEFQKIKNFQKISKKTLRCDESNGVKFSEIFVHLV